MIRSISYPPVYRRYPVLLKELVRLGKVSAAEKSVVCRQRAWVSALKYKVLGVGYELCLGTSVRAP